MQEALKVNKNSRQGQSRDVVEQGRLARREGKQPEDCPYTDYPGRQLRNAWLEGYHEEAQKRAPVVFVQSVEVVTQGTFWPKGKALPQVAKSIGDEPCPKCLMVRLPSGGKSSSRSQNTDGMQYYRCRNCEHRWKLRREEAQ